MNTEGAPLAEHPLGFWIVFGVMIAAILILAAYFKKNGRL
jgi:Mg2+ and Co2+ transporter CorA